MKIFAVVLAACVGLTGCEQVKALISGGLKCHDPDALNAVAAIVQEETIKLLRGDKTQIAYAENVLHVTAFDFENVLEVGDKNSRARKCDALMVVRAPHQSVYDVEILAGLSGGSALANEVLSIQGLSMRRPVALSYPPTIDEGVSLKWGIAYDIRTTSDGKQQLVYLDKDVSAAIADFLRYYVRKNSAVESE